MSSDTEKLTGAAQTICPNCRRENQCQNAKISSDNTATQQYKGNKDCWCMSVDLTVKQQKEVDKYGSQPYCICAQCIDSFE